MTVDSGSPAAVAIHDAFIWDVVPCETDMVKRVAAAERTILNQFRAREASSYDQFQFGWKRRILRIEKRIANIRLMSMVIPYNMLCL